MIAGTDRKELMKKLPKFIYDEEKALEVRNHFVSSYLLLVISCVDAWSSLGTNLVNIDLPNGNREFYFIFW